VKRRRPTKRHTAVPAKLIADIQVWRAATQIDPSDLRPSGHPSSAAPPESSSSNSTSGSPPTTGIGDGGNCWPPKPRPPPQTHSCRSRQKGCTTSPRPASNATLLVSPAAAAVPLADHHPAAALWWRILDQLPRTNLEPGPSDNQHRPSDQAHAREVTGAAATRAALGAASRRRPAPLNLAFRPITTPEMDFGDLSPNPMISIQLRGAPSAPRVVLPVGALRVGTRGAA